MGGFGKSQLEKIWYWLSCILQNLLLMRKQGKNIMTWLVKNFNTELKNDRIISYKPGYYED
jgi:hypothetical protein